MGKETKKSVLEQAADALRLWSNAWNEFDKTGKTKPASIEEVIEPFIKMEKEQMTMKKCYHPLTDRRYISDFHFECTICGFCEMNV
jgi:hypothetical protein